MLETHLRQASSVLLESAIRLAPPGTRDWGRAMRSELDYVEGAWAAVMWALGGASVLVKQTLLSLIIPGRGGQELVPDGGLFAKSPSLRKAGLVAGGACILLTLLFFATPPFRQAFQVALSPWIPRAQLSPRIFPSGLAALAKRAEAQRDAEGLAFCAVRLQDTRESARLAEEAVRLDSNLLWVYAVVAMRLPGLPATGRWIDKLKGWDEQNALFYLLAAQSIERANSHHDWWWPPRKEREQAWQAAMAAAFHSSQFDDYLDRVAQLNRRVIPRYGFYDLYEVESRDGLDLPTYVFDDSERYAQSLLESGAELEAKGDHKGGRERYWTVARFGQLVDSQGHTDLERWMGTTLQALAYGRLQTSFEKEGNSSEAALFAYLVAKFDPVKGQHPGFPGESAFGMKTAERNAAVVQISGLMILLFSGLVVVAALILIFSSPRRASLVAQRARPVAIIVILSGALGMLFSSITLYLTYRPYWYIFQGAILNGERVPTRDLRYFLNAFAMYSSGSPHLFHTLLTALLYAGSPGFLFYVWTGVTLLGVLGLALILLRGLRGRPRAHPP